MTDDSGKAADVSELSDEALECRDLGHAWFKVRDFRKVMGPGGRVSQMTRQLKCARCGLPGEDVFNRGDMDRAHGRRYQTSAVRGYYLAPGSGRLSAAEVRLEALQRGYVDDDESDARVTNIRRKRKRAG